MCNNSCAPKRPKGMLRNNIQILLRNLALNEESDKQQMLRYEKQAIEAAQKGCIHAALGANSWAESYRTRLQAHAETRANLNRLLQSTEFWT